MEEDISNVFNVDIQKLTTLLNKCVNIKLKNTIDEIKGRIYTIDPVSKNIVVAKKINGDLSVTIIFNHAVEEITILEGIQDELSETELNKLFSNQQYHTQPSLEKEYVIDWLTNSKIPFTLINDSIDIEGVLVHPPYTSETCVSSNLIKLSRIQNLLTSIPVRIKD